MPVWKPVHHHACLCPHLPSQLAHAISSAWHARQPSLDTAPPHTPTKPEPDPLLGAEEALAAAQAGSQQLGEQLQASTQQAGRELADRLAAAQLEAQGRAEQLSGRLLALQQELDQRAAEASAAAQVQAQGCRAEA